jgi:hypothetical protein
MRAEFNVNPKKTMLAPVMLNPSYEAAPIPKSQPGADWQ